MSTDIIMQQAMELVYEGSVKRVFQKFDTDSLYFEFTDDYSVFDWGKMPDTIKYKGRALAILGAFFFEKFGDPVFWQQLKGHPGLKFIKQEWLDKRFDSDLFKNDLQKNGAAHHFRQLVTKSGNRLNLSEAAEVPDNPLLEVLGATVVHPEPANVCGQIAYFYPSDAAAISRRLIPLEVVFRFGMPSGSSLQGRLEKDPDYARVLGLPQVPKPNEMFPYPVIEFFTKLEPSDRLLSVQEALLISQLSPDKFKQLIDLTHNLATGLYAICAGCGIELWDGKFEFITDGDAIMLADSIGPDELRLLYKGRHLSKEMLRQVYRGGAWEAAVKEAKKIAAQTGIEDWKKVCIEQLKQEPKPLPANIKHSVDSLYPMLVNVITGQTLFEHQPDLGKFIDSMPSLEVVL